MRELLELRRARGIGEHERAQRRAIQAAIRREHARAEALGDRGEQRAGRAPRPRARARPYR